MSLPAWTPSLIPTLTVLSTIATSDASGLQSTLSSAIGAIATATAPKELHSLSQVARGALASLDIISNERVLATATASLALAQATDAIFNATLNLKDLEWEQNLYDTNLSMPANAIFTAVFGLLMVLFIGLTVYSRHVYFGTAMFLGSAGEFAGYLARVLAVNDTANSDLFLCQFVSLTISPAFTMAAIYFFMAQVLVVYQLGVSRRLCMLKPLWFSYIFVVCDVLSLVIQAAGGAMASLSLDGDGDAENGTHVMVAGLAFQVFSMLFFIFITVNFFYRVWFRSDHAIRFSFANLFALLFNTPKGKQLSHQLDPTFSQEYASARRLTIFGYLPLILYSSVLFIYIRCIYRVIELAQGWSGYLITHEVYIMTLDALMVCLTCAIYVPFHPVFIFRKTTNLSFKTVKRKTPVREKVVEVSSDDLTINPQLEII